MSTILLLHGALGAASQFDALARKLQHTFTCASIDFPLHGQNAQQSPFSIPDLADYLIRTIEEMNVENVSVFGYSMGGYVAMYAAGIRPELFNGIMTLATKYRWSEAIAEKEKAMLNAEEMERKIPAFVSQLTQRHPHIDWKEMVRNTASLLDSLGKENLLTPTRLNDIPVKVRVGVGDKDAMVSLDETVEAYKQLKQGSLYVLPDTKHPFEKVNENLLVCQINDFFL